jgi:Flp pilus assembly protein TadB
MYSLVLRVTTPKYMLSVFRHLTGHLILGYCPGTVHVQSEVVAHPESET